MKSRLNKSALMTLLITNSIFLGCTATAFAADAANSGTNSDAAVQNYNLNDMVVTATKTPQRISKTQANVSVITRQQIEKAHYSTLSEALRNVPGVQILSYGQAGYSSGSFRLNGADNVVVLIDGVRASYSDNPFQVEYYPMDNVEKIEIVKGAMSALYGADAKGGVINIITRTPQKDQTKITTAVGSFGTESYSLHNEGRDKTWGYSIDLDKDLEGSMKDGNGTSYDQYMRSTNASVKLYKDLGNGSNLFFTYDDHNYDWQYQNTPLYAYDYGDGKTTSGTTQESAFMGKWTQRVDDTATNVLAIRNGEYQRNYSNIATSDWLNNAIYKTFDVSDYFTKQFGNNHTTILGGDYSRNKENTISNYSGTPSSSSGNIISKSVYMQDDWKFDPRWNLIYGVRYDNHSWAGEKTTPNINLGYTFDNKTNMYFGYSRFFVAPTLYQYTDPTYGNRQLKPETGYNYELGINHKLSNTLSLTSHIFKRKTNNKIVYDSLIYGYKNVKEDATGFDLQLNKIFNKHLTAYAGYTYNHFTADTLGDNDNGYFPKYVVNIGADYSINKFDVNLNTRAELDRGTGTGSVSNMFPSNSYWIVDMAVNYQATKNIKLFAKANNLFNKYYAEQTDIPWGGSGQGGYYAMPGRSLLFGMEYSF